MTTTVDIERWAYKPWPSSEAADRWTVVYTDPTTQRVYRVATRETELEARRFARTHHWTVGSVTDPEQAQWANDHPDGEISEEESLAMCEYSMTTPVRALVYGSRTWQDEQAVRAFVSSLPADSVVIHGGAEGADSIAGYEAEARGLETIVYRANWFAHGKAAGPIRNQRMIDEGKPTIARGYRRGFKSPGTDDMTRRLLKAGVPHEVIEEQPQ